MHSRSGFWQFTSYRSSGYGFPHCSRWRPKYYAAIETRTYLEDELEGERFLEVRQVKTHAMIAAIEVLSLRNQCGDGRVSYLKNDRQFLRDKLENQCRVFTELNSSASHP
jgi:hypothetical protein